MLFICLTPFTKLLDIAQTHTQTNRHTNHQSQSHFSTTYKQHTHLHTPCHTYSPIASEHYFYFPPNQHLILKSTTTKPMPLNQPLSTSKLQHPPNTSLPIILPTIQKPTHHYLCFTKINNKSPLVVFRIDT